MKTVLLVLFVVTMSGCVVAPVEPVPGVYAAPAVVVPHRHHHHHRHHHRHHRHRYWR